MPDINIIRPQNADCVGYLGAFAAKRLELPSLSDILIYLVFISLAITALDLVTKLNLAEWFIITAYLFANLIIFINFIVKLYGFCIIYFGKPPYLAYKLQDPKNLPEHSILVPLFKENEATIKHLINSLEQIHFPKDKLSIIFLLEEIDTETLQILTNKIPNSSLNSRLIVIPKTEIRTKPNALNYGLKFVNTPYFTIYDAEDRPETDQIHKVLSLFNEYKDIGCIQARLNFFNRDSNFLCRLFSLEYLVWFRYLIRFLEQIDTIIPLGGTSCHFKTKDIIKIKGWDAYNVTEDAELGVRLKAFKIRTVNIDSTTWEECPQNLSDWIKQRSRWFKGFMLTHLTYTNRKKYIGMIFNLKNFFMFEFFIGLSGFVFFLGFLTLLMLLLFKLNIYEVDFWGSAILKIITICNLINTILVGLIFYLSARKEGFNYPIYTYFIAFSYFALHIWSSFIAVYELLENRFLWRKTRHFNHK